MTSGATTVYVRDAFGQMAAEYDSVGVVPDCVTCYLSADHLGSTRMVTDQGGNVVARHDYLPYGEEVAGVAGRVAGSGFGSSANVTQMFTGQERDGGTLKMDYFNARHFSAVLGGFAQVDPGSAGGDFLRPQSWNGYGYVLGNPLGETDPSGMTTCYVGNDACQGKRPSNQFGSGVFGGASLSWISTTTTVLSTSGSDLAGLINYQDGTGNFEAIDFGMGVSFSSTTTNSYSSFVNSSSITGFVGLEWNLDSVPKSKPSPKVRMFGTHWCGPGGDGPTVNALDDACKEHDSCYDKWRLTVGSNLFGGTNSDLEHLAECNQALCDAATSKAANVRGSSRVDWYFSLVPFGSCLGGGDSWRRMKGNPLSVVPAVF